MANFYDSQLRNRNFLSPIGFKFTLKTKEKVIHIKIDKIDNLLIKREDYNLDFNLSKTCVKLIAEIKNKQLPLNITTTIKY